MRARSQQTLKVTTSSGLALGTGHRLTKQRREVYDILLSKRDHPTATELFVRAKERVPHISLATVYNCLETLTSAGLVRQVNLDRGPARYCPNLQEHGHFVCESCGTVIDIHFSEKPMTTALKLPRGTHLTSVDITLKGRCEVCGQSAEKKEKVLKPKKNS